MLLLAPAKINLTLDIKGLLPDGYHRVETVMQAVDLCDKVEVTYESSDKPLGIEIEIDKPYIPVDSSNLAYKAALLMANAANVSTGTIRIKIEKKIPVGAGLGGGSSDAAAVAVILNKLFSRDSQSKKLFDNVKLCELTGNIGADVPFLTMVMSTNGKISCALGTEKGQVLTPIVNGLVSFVTLAKPRISVSTKEVYQGMDSVEILERPNLEKLLASLKKRNKKDAFSSMANALESYTLKKYPKVSELKEKMEAYPKARFTMMSGSGPTIVNYFDNIAEARACCMSMRDQGYEAFWAKLK